MYSLIRP
jgi:hypothetical protein